MIRFSLGQTPKFDGKRTQRLMVILMKVAPMPPSFLQWFLPFSLKAQDFYLFVQMKRFFWDMSPILSASQLSLALNSPYSCLCASWGRLGCSLFPSHCQERAHGQTDCSCKASSGTAEEVAHKYPQTHRSPACFSKRNG